MYIHVAKVQLGNKQLRHITSSHFTRDSLIFTPSDSRMQPVSVKAVLRKYYQLLIPMINMVVITWSVVMLK